MKKFICAWLAMILTLTFGLVSIAEDTVPVIESNASSNEAAIEEVSALQVELEPLDPVPEAPESPQDFGTDPRMRMSLLSLKMGL